MPGVSMCILLGILGCGGHVAWYSLMWTDVIRGTLGSQWNGCDFTLKIRSRALAHPNGYSLVRGANSCRYASYVESLCLMIYLHVFFWRVEILPLLIFLQVPGRLCMGGDQRYVWPLHWGLVQRVARWWGLWCWWCWRCCDGDDDDDDDYLYYYDHDADYLRCPRSGEGGVFEQMVKHW